MPAMYLLLAGVDQYLHRANLGLTDVFAQRIELTSAEIEKRIEAAYRKLAGSSQDLVGLAELRAMLGGAATEDVDAVLKDMSKAGRVSLFPESNRKVLTSADHEAAIRIGGEDNHLISIEAS